jgi:DNA polymerase-3 subunit beta
MKVEISRESFIEAVSLSEKVSGKNLTLPVLNCLLLTAKNGLLSVKATNLDLGIEISVPAKVEAEGEAAVPSSVFYNTLLSTYEGRSITVETKDGNVVVQTPNGKTVIKTQPHDDFPTIPKLEGVKTFETPASIFVDGIKSVWYSASHTSIKPELSSVYIYEHEKKLFFVATDSFRLAEKSVLLKTAVHDFEPVLIPLKNIPEVLRVLERSPDDVSIAVSQNQISFSYGSLYLTSRLIDGVFPDYKQIIPKEVETEAVVLKQDLSNVLKKTTIFTDAYNQVQLDIDPVKKVFTISSRNSDIGETRDTLHASLSGKPLEIRFNHKYVSDSFQSIHPDSVSLSFAGAARPMVIRGVSDASFLYLVMPMNR